MICRANDSKALIIAAHGSTRELGVNSRIKTLADHVCRRNLFEEVVAAFHQGEPAYEEALNGVTSERVIVVPFMASEGYFATERLPAALALSPRFEKVKLIQTRPVGTHPQLAATIAMRAQQLASDHEVHIAGFTIALVGHGTPRNTASRMATQSAADTLSQLLPGVQVLTAYLDDEPPVESIVARATHQLVIVMPFLIGGGTHAVRDLPLRLGLSPILSSKPPAKWNPKLLAASVVASHTRPDSECVNKITPAADAKDFSSEGDDAPVITVWAGGQRVIIDMPVGQYPEIVDWVIQLATHEFEKNNG